MITLRNVIDIRSRKFHSVVIVSKSKARFFVPVEEYEQNN